MRLLPILLITLFLTLGFRVNHLVVEGKDVMQAMLVSESIAEDKEAKKDDKKEIPKTEEEKTEAKAEEPRDDGIAKPGEKAAPGQPQAIALPDMNGKGCEFSQTEIDILQSLGKRRDEIEQHAKSIDLRENVLKATEQNIEKKLAEMRDLKKSIEDLLLQYDAKEQEKIKSLVKIYQNMKPKDAARIFEELEMDVLLPVVSKMDEKKISPILAAMNPKKAQEVTVQLSEQKKLPKPEEMDEPEPLAPKAPPAAPAPAATAPASAAAPAPGDATAPPAGAGSPAPASATAPPQLP
jgi:flagellar motility protein MotE (MotC chaperone)